MRGDEVRVWDGKEEELFFFWGMEDLWTEGKASEECPADIISLLSGEEGKVICRFGWVSNMVKVLLKELWIAGAGGGGKPFTLLYGRDLEILREYHSILDYAMISEVC